MAQAGEQGNSAENTRDIAMRMCLQLRRGNDLYQFSWKARQDTVSTATILLEIYSRGVVGIIMTPKETNILIPRPGNMLF